MLIRLWRYTRGYLRIRITGSGTERFINGCRHRNIRLWNLQVVNGAYEVNMFVCDFKKLKTILRKTGTKVTIVKRIGLPFFHVRVPWRHLLYFHILHKLLQSSVQVDDAQHPCLTSGRC